jgi:hypothetical protein
MTDLADFEVHDPTEEFESGADVVAKSEVMDRLKEAYAFASERGAGETGPKQTRALAKMNAIGDALEDLDGGASVQDVRVEMVRRRKAAEDELDDVQEDERDAELRGERDGADEVVLAIEGRS